MARRSRKRTIFHPGSYRTQESADVAEMQAMVDDPTHPAHNVPRLAHPNCVPRSPEQAALSDKPCPACGQLWMRCEDAQNASSRYMRDVYICSGCGVGEALNGFFWKERAYAAGLGDQIKKEFI